MAYSDVIPASILARLMGEEFQPSLPIYTPKYRLEMEYITSLPDNIVCEVSETGSSWSSKGQVDHPSFTRLRNHLETCGFIKTCRNSVNGDTVLRKFILNDTVFNPGDRFYSASAMRWLLERNFNA